MERVAVDENARKYITKKVFENSLNFSNIPWHVIPNGNRSLYTFTTSKGRVRVEFVDDMIDNIFILN